MSGYRRTDTLDKTVSYLAKRDGIDKTLKIIRYAARLALATSGDKNDAFITRLESLESSLGTSRKAYRLGKFLQNVNAARKVPLRAPHAALELIANLGEGIYYFVEQFQWLVKAGVLPAHFAAPLTKISASGELVGYFGSIALAILRLHYLLEREVALIAELQRKRRERAERAAYAAVYGGSAVMPSMDTAALTDDEKDEALISEIKALRSRRALRTLGLAQDLADMLLALADLHNGSASRRANGGVLSNRALLAAAGLLSGCLSAYKNWPGTVIR